MNRKAIEEVRRCIQYAKSQGFKAAIGDRAVHLSFENNRVVVDNDDPNAVLLAITFLQNLKAGKR